MDEELAKQLDREILEIQDRARHDARRDRPNRDTVEKLRELERRYRDRAVSRERLAYLLHDAADRLERRLDDVEAAALIFRESWKRYSDTRWGGKECLRRYRALTLEIGAQFPYLEGVDLQGQPIVYRPEVADLSIILFVEVKQPVCRQALEKISRGLAEQENGDVPIIVAALDDVPDRWRSWLSEKDLRVQTMSPAAPTVSWVDRFALNAVPRGFLVDRSGRVLATEMEFERILEAVAGHRR